MEDQQSKTSYFFFSKSKHIKDLIKKGRNVYTIKSKIAVDKIYNFENIDGALKDIEDKLNLDGKIILPRTKSNTRIDKRSYKEILLKKERKFIEETFIEEIQNQGYKF